MLQGTVEDSFDSVSGPHRCLQHSISHTVQKHYVMVNVVNLMESILEMTLNGRCRSLKSAFASG